MAPDHTDAPEGDASDVRTVRQYMPAALLAIISVALVTAIVFVVGAIVTNRPEAAADDAAAAAGCLPSDLRITADPAVAEALESILRKPAGGSGDCAGVTVTAEPSATTAVALGKGERPDFDIWVPDSGMWPAYVAGVAESTGSEAPELVVGDTIASTPIVLVAPEALASSLSGENAAFATLAKQQSFAALLPDPATVASSSAALLALQTAVGGDARTFTGLVLSLARSVPSTEDALNEVAGSSTSAVAVTTEQAMSRYADAQGDHTPLSAIYPTDVKASLGMPLVTVADSSPTTLEAVDTIAEAVSEDDGRLAKFGLRDAAGHSEDADLAPVAPTDSTNQYEVLSTWRVLTAPSRMLALNDVSGSMSKPAAGEMTRMDLFEQAAVRAIHSLSTESSLAVWVFSSRRIGGQDWQEVVPFGPLGDPAHKKLSLDTANNLHSYVGGGTGLYDSVLAAVSYMRETYVPGEVNLVLLNTDGYNEDDEGLTLDELLTELEKIHDPAKPVPVIAIGYGPDTDQDALEKIAAATEGAAYQALKPTDISTVLVDAVAQRGCRPYCS
ncbi:VWA domain-containing protein [Microbacterium bovistercoris]|nr:VWA domain-containing protein [Microbacterium bovistercoris]